MDYYTYKENGKYYIKIKTENEIPLSYSININADVVANPLLSSSKEEIKLYAFNKRCDNYDKKIIDEYDRTMINVPLAVPDFQILLRQL